MNTQNIKNLLRTYFIENWKRDLWYFGVIAALATCSEFLGSEPQVPELAAAVILMLFYSARSFVGLSNRANCMHLLLVPGTAAEKVAVKMFLSCIYFVAGCFLAILLGDGIGYALRYLHDGADTPAFIFFFNEYFNSIEYFLMLYFFMSILFFTSIYFKGKNIAKTLLIVFTLSVFFGVLMWGMAWINYKLLVPDGMQIKGLMWHGDFKFSTPFDWMDHVLSIGSIIYFYGLSFLRFKETEA